MSDVIGLLRLAVVLIAVVVIVQTVFKKNESYHTDQIGTLIQSMESSTITKDQSRHR